MTWTITWADLSKENKADRLYLETTRQVKHAGPRDCCLCPKPIQRITPLGSTKWDWRETYRQGAGNENRLAHVACIERYFTGVAVKSVPRPERRKVGAKIYTEIDLQRARIKSYNEGYKEGQFDLLNTKGAHSRNDNKHNNRTKTGGRTAVRLR